MSNQTLPVSCVGRTTPSFAKEHMRGTANSGYVVAEETFCSRNPNFTASLGPGGTHTEWAIFHNVPWQGGEVSLEWMPYGFSEWVDSWYSPYPSATPPPAECPSELVTLGTCQPANQPGQVLPPRFVILGGQSAQGNQGTQLTPEQLQQIQNSVLCTTEVAVHIIPGLGEVEVVTKIVSAVMVGNDVIAIVQDPNNPLNYFALVLEFVPFGSCFELLGSMFIPPYKPAIIPPGVTAPMPVPTPTPPKT
jgi:hypothetical protein